MFHRFLLLSLTFILLLNANQTLASHEASEPTDGTVGSFRWLSKPLSLNQVPIQHWQGERIKLSKFKDKIVLLNIWASWCPPCVRELPALDRLQQRLGKKDFVVVAVSIDTDPELAGKMFYDQLGLEHIEMYIEPPEQLGKFFPIDVLPSNFLIDRNTQAMGLLRSFVDWDHPMADTLIKRLIDGVEVSVLREEKS